MEKFVITKDNGITAIQTAIKNEMTETVISALEEKYGKENVAIGRYGSSSKVNGIIVRVGTIQDEAGFEYDLCVTNESTVKSYKEKKTKRYTIEPFDFEGAKQEYEDYLTDKATKAAEAKARKANSPKSKKEAEKAQRKAETEAAAERAKQRINEKTEKMLADAAAKREASKNK